MEVYVKPDEIWDYFQENKSRLSNSMDCVVELFHSKTKEPLLRVYLSEERFRPSMTLEKVLSDGSEEVVSTITTIFKNDCVEEYSSLLKSLEKLDEEFNSDEEYLDEHEEADEIDVQIVEERELQLKEALAKFLNILVGNHNEEFLFDDEELEEILEQLEVLMSDLGYTCYRPQIVDGKLYEYPFELEEDDFYGQF